MHFQTEEEEEEEEEGEEEVKKRVCEPGRPGLAGDSCLPGPARRGLRLLTWSAPPAPPAVCLGDRFGIAFAFHTFLQDLVRTHFFLFSF